jgi:hypothetical protein
MQLYGIIYTLISLKREREKKREGRDRGCREKGKKKIKRRDELYLFNEWVSK